MRTPQSWKYLGEWYRSMKKSLVLALAVVTLFGCACTQKTEPSGPSDPSDSVRSYRYPDELLFDEGGTDSMTVFRCGAVYYACVDGSQQWETLYSCPFETEEGVFVHIEADYTKAYGGVAGFAGNKSIKNVRDEKLVTLKEVIASDAIAGYQISEASFAGLRLIEKDGNNYLICRTPLGQYRLYDDDMNLMCSNDTSMACYYAVYNEGESIRFERGGNIPYTVIRIGETYYGYSRYNDGPWKPILNMEFENSPVGFELEDGQAMKIDSTSYYIVNGGDAGYDDYPMFERMDHYNRTTYAAIAADAAKIHWEQASSYEDGHMYDYYSGTEEYVIFYLDGRFYVYYETGSAIDSETFAGGFTSADEVNKTLGI